MFLLASSASSMIRIKLSSPFILEEARNNLRLFVKSARITGLTSSVSATKLSHLLSKVFSTRHHLLLKTAHALRPRLSEVIRIVHNRIIQNQFPVCLKKCIIGWSTKRIISQRTRCEDQPARLYRSLNLAWLNETEQMGSHHVVDEQRWRRCFNDSVLRVRGNAIVCSKHVVRRKDDQKGFSIHVTRKRGAENFLMALWFLSAWSLEMFVFSRQIRQWKFFFWGGA